VCYLCVPSGGQASWVQSKKVVTEPWRPPKVLRRDVLRYGLNPETLAVVRQGRTDDYRFALAVG
jgi:hypothetical protein